LNVLYLIPSEAFLLREIFNLYPSPAKLSNDYFDSLGLADASRLELGKFIGSLPDNHVVAAFAHDADPLYIFGSSNTLRSMVELASSLD